LPNGFRSRPNAFTSFFFLPLFFSNSTHATGDVFSSAEASLLSLRLNLGRPRIFSPSTLPDVLFFLGPAFPLKGFSSALLLMISLNSSVWVGARLPTEVPPSLWFRGHAPLIFLRTPPFSPRHGFHRGFRSPLLGGSFRKCSIAKAILFTSFLPSPL